MKTLKYVMAAAAGIALLSACQKDDEHVQINPENVVPSQFVGLPTRTVVLHVADADAPCDTIRWTQTDFSYPAAVGYTLQIRLKGSQEFTDLGSVQGVTKWAAKTSLLNNTLVRIGCTPGEENDVELRVSASVSPAYPSVVSEPAVVRFSPYDSEVSYPSLWVIGGYCDWHHESADRLYSLKDNGIYSGWIDMYDPSGFKFTSAPHWDGVNYGGELDALSTDGSAPNIVLAESGYYFFEVNTKLMTAQIKHTVETLGLIGSAVPGGWDAQTNLGYDPASKLWKGTMEMQRGEFKVRMNDDWELSFGAGADAQEGILNGSGNVAFTMPDGLYDVTVNLNRAVPTYSFTAR